MFNILGSILGKRVKESTPEGSESDSDSKFQDADGVGELMAEEEEEPIVGDFAVATLSQLLTTIIPDAEIHSPHVICVGGQSAGKTMMIISLVFHHLVENVSVSPLMVEKLLKFFRTGDKMVTRRPVTVQFLKQLSADKQASIVIKLGREQASFEDPKFDEIVQRVHRESEEEGKAYLGELRIVITAPDLPNSSFTDLPGLTTTDRTLSDNKDSSIRQMVRTYMSRPNSTLLVVEPAHVGVDFETSQVAPLLLDLQRTSRPDIFKNAVLVLSKCDTVRAGLEGKLMRLIELSSPQLVAFPYEHVVGVVNKRETLDSLQNNSQTNSQNNSQEQRPSELSYAAFRLRHMDTKAHEKEIFAAYRSKSGHPIDPATQCGTAAVFYQMDAISFLMVQRSFARGLEAIEHKISAVEEQISNELAPPIVYYERAIGGGGGGGAANERGAMGGSGGNEGVAGNGVSGGSGNVSKARRRVLLADLGRVVHNQLAEAFQSVQLYPRHSYDADQNKATQRAFLATIEVEWPDFVSGNLHISKRHEKALLKVKDFFDAFVSQRLRREVVQAVGGMCSVHHPFHRFDRFTALCARVKAGLLALYPRVAVAAQDKVAHHLQHFWDSQLPYGVDMSGLMRLLEAAKHIAMREVSDLLTAELRGDTFQQLLWDDSLFTESEAFVARRDELHAHWARLKKQKKILEDCRKVESNATLRAALLEAHSRESSASRAQKDWIRFWREVEESAVRVHDICCTSDFDHEGVGAFMSPHACRANNTDSGSSGSSSGSSSGAMDGAGDADTGLHSRLVSGTPGSASRPSAPGTGGVGGGACAGAGSSRKEYNNNTILSKAAAERERAERGVEGGGHLGTEGEAPWKRLREEQPVAQSYTNYLAPSAYNASAPASAPAPAPTRVKENWDDDSGEDKPAHVEVGAGVGAGAGTGVGVGTGTGVGVGSPSWLQGFSLTHSYLKNALSPSAPVTAHMPTSASKPKPAHGSGGGSAYVAGGGTPPHAFGSARQDANALADLNHLSATSASAYVYTTWEGGVATANATAATSSSKRPRSAVPTSTSAPTTASAPTSGSSGDNAYMGSRGKAAMPLRTSGADTGAEADLDTYVDPKEEAEREERAETERGWSQGNEYQYPSYLQSIVASSKRPNPDSSSKGRGRRSPEGHLQGAGMGAGAGGGSSRKHHTAQANSLNHSHRSHSRESKGEVEAIDLMDSD